MCQQNDASVLIKSLIFEENNDFSNEVLWITQMGKLVYQGIYVHCALDVLYCMSGEYGIVLKTLPGQVSVNRHEK